MAVVVEELEGKGAEKSSNKVVTTPVTQEEIDLIVQKRIDEALSKIGNTQVQNNMSGLQDLGAIISRGISDGMKSTTGQFEFGSGYREEDIDIDDLLAEEDCVTFAVHKIFDIIVGDVRNGKAIRVPYEPIHFTIQGSKITKNGKESQITNFATYTCRSKKELKFLREHTRYKVTFFDRIDAAISSNAKHAGILAKYMNMMNAMNQYQVTRYAQDHGVSFNEDMATMKAEVATKLAEQEMQKLNSYETNLFEDQMKEALSVGKEVI